MNSKADFGLNNEELKFLKKLNTPNKIQDYLDTLPVNWEKRGETYMSPRRVLLAKKAHCIEGAMLAVLTLKLSGQKAWLLDLKSYDGDDHVVAMYEQNGYFGAISKTNHAVLRFRDPVYKNVHELAKSYFHEYINTKTGEKTLRSYSKPYDLFKYFKNEWIVTDREMHDLAESLDKAPHYKIFPTKKAQKNIKNLRRADKMELKAGRIIEWKKDNPRT